MRVQIRAMSVVAAFGVLSLLLAGPASAGAADDVTYYEDVLPIVQENCQSCHREAGQNITGIVAPMALMTYEDTRPWARSIAQKVQTHEMPPWYGEAPRGVFSNERGLTEAEIETIVAWVDAGAPAGDMAAAPATRVFGDENGWRLGTPDFTLKMPEYLVPDDSYDLQTSFTVKIPDEFLPDGGVWVRGWEFRTGETGDRVHHWCGSIQNPRVVVEADQGQGDGDGEDEGAAAARGGSLGCVSAGTESKLLPEGWGMFIETGSSARYGMHYNKQPGPGTAFYNQSEYGFYLSKEPVKYRFENSSIGNTGYEIPAHRARYRVGAGRMLEQDTYVVNYWPHAHFRGVAARYTATYPDGREELLLDVPEWEQGWQETYWYNEPKLLPKGTMIDVSFWYDNTSENGMRKGFNPDRSLGHGPRTNDSMALGFFGYAEEVDVDPAAESQN